MEANPGASVDELKANKKAVEEVAAPIFTKLYGQGGGGGSDGAGSDAGSDNDAGSEEKDEL